MFQGHHSVNHCFLLLLLLRFNLITLVEVKLVFLFPHLEQQLFSQQRVLFDVSHQLVLLDVFSRLEGRS